jgi:FkbM family methyltransferase
VVIPEPLLWWAATRWARLHARAHRAGLRLRGLGWLLRRIEQERVLPLGGVLLHFDPRVAASYDRLVAGEHNEPETRAFLDHVLDAPGDRITFVNVGANVGEFLIPAAAHPRVSHAIAFEALPTCADVCARSAVLNGFRNVEVRRAVVGDGSERRFATHTRSPNVSAIAASGDPVTTVRLDDELPDLAGPAILLIDVEGAEPLVLAGASELVTRLRPLIVFEYNFVSRKHFALDRVRGLLGPGYAVYRLRADGRLDDRVEESWNCVAVPAATAFESTCRTLLVP